MDILLTNDSNALICLLYKDYCQRRKNGISKGNAKEFGSSIIIQRDISPKWSVDDVDETCRELHRAGLLECLYADNIVYRAFLSDLGIIYMEKRFKDGLTEVLDYLGKIRNILPI